MNDTFIYDTNETMHIIGKQHPLLFIGPGTAAGKDFRAALDTYKQQEEIDLFNMALDFFMLGVIYGKKADRATRNRKEMQPLNKGWTMEEIAAEFTSKPFLLDFMKEIRAAELTPEQLQYMTAFIQEMAKKGDR